MLRKRRLVQLLLKVLKIVLFWVLEQIKFLKYLQLSEIILIFAASECKFWLSGKHVRP